MGLETATYVADLVVTNPVGATDAKSEGDNHLRLIKSALKASFSDLPTTLIAYMRLRGLRNVVDFSAVGDGVTDCYAAFTSALSTYGGAHISIAAGNYRLPFTAANGFSIPADTVIEGAGMANTTLTFVPNSATFRSFMVLGNNIIFRNLKITCIYPAGVGGFQMFDPQGSNILFENCDFDGATTYTPGVLSHTALLMRFPAGVSEQTDYTFLNCDFHRFSYTLTKNNLSVSTQRRFTFAYCDFYENFVGDCSFNSPSGITDDVQVHNCRFRDSLHEAAALTVPVLYLGMASVKNFRISNNSFSGDIGVGVNSAGAIHLEEDCVGGVVIGNTINTRGVGLQISANNIAGPVTQPSYITISDNVFQFSGTPREAGSLGVEVVQSTVTTLTAKNIIFDSNIIVGYFTGFVSHIVLNDGSAITDNYVDNCVVAYSVGEGGIIMSGNTAANSDDGVVSASYLPNINGLVIDDQTFINCITTAFSSESTITLLNPKFVWNSFDHPGGGATVSLSSVTLGIPARVYGSHEIVTDCETANSYSRVSETVTWTGAVFTNPQNIAIQPGAVTVTSAHVASKLAVNVTASAPRTGVRVQAKLNGMVVVSL